MARRPGTPRLLRQINDRSALELLLLQGLLTRAELGELTGLSKVTSGQLSWPGWRIEGGSPRPGNGRRPGVRTPRSTPSIPSRRTSPAWRSPSTASPRGGRRHHRTADRRGDRRPVRGPGSGQARAQRAPPRLRERRAVSLDQLCGAWSSAPAASPTPAAGTCATPSTCPRGTSGSWPSSAPTWAGPSGIENDVNLAALAEQA